jgi:2'-5' RNA ligase
LTGRATDPIGRPDEQVRVFLAILISPQARQALENCMERLSGLAPDGVRWVDPQGIHLTLRFLGNIPAASVDDVLAAQGAAAAACPPFSVRLSGLGMFPNRGRPRVLWAGVTGELDALGRLQQAVESQLERASFPRDKRPFAPHLTLGRVRGRVSDRDRTKIAGAVSSVTLEETGPWLVEESHLIRSTLTPQGAVYMSMGSASLAPPGR